MNKTLGQWERREFEKEVVRLRDRIAELEAAQQWHDASEPPEMEGENRSRLIEVQYKSGNIGMESYSEDYESKVDWATYVLRWRELPPMPEMRETLETKP